VCGRRRVGSNWKHRSRQRVTATEESRVEVEELELESYGSGEDRWRARGLQAITFGLLGLKELDRERNELLREQNELKGSRIAISIG